MPRQRLMALAPWHGSNRVRASLSVQQFGTIRPNGTPSWNALFVPFAGAMTEPLVAPRCRTEVMNDLHADILNLAAVMADPISRRSLRRRLSATPMHECVQGMARSMIGQTFPQATVWTPGIITTGMIDRAYWYFVTVWQGMNGRAGTPNESKIPFSIRWEGNGGDSATRWVNVVQGTSIVGQRLEGMTFLHRDAFDLLADIRDDPKTVIYLDPPFDLAGGYQHDFEVGDHHRLKAALVRFAKARVVLRYYRTPLLADLYNGWRIVPTPGVKYMGNLGTPAPECLYLNQSPIGVPEQFERGSATPNASYMSVSGTEPQSEPEPSPSAPPESSESTPATPSRRSRSGRSAGRARSNASEPTTTTT